MPTSEAAVLEYFQRLMSYGVVVPDDSSRKRFKFPRPAGNLDGPYMYVFHRMVLLLPLELNGRLGAKLWKRASRFE